MTAIDLAASPALALADALASDHGGVIVAGYTEAGTFYAVETVKLTEVPDRTGKDGRQRATVGNPAPESGAWLLVRHGRGAVYWCRTVDGLAGLGIDLVEAVAVRSWE